MGRRIVVRAVPKEEPDAHLYVLALLALARQLEEDERQAKQQQPQQPARGQEVPDDQG